jgi:copper chaperone
MTNAERSYAVTGMSCGHCVASVQEEVAEVAGVGRVDVDLATGRLDVAGSGFSDADIQAAVTGAGYGLVELAPNGGPGGDAGH